MNKPTTILLATLTTAGLLQAQTVLEVDFSHLTAGTTISDGDRIEDISGNGYHAFFGGALGLGNFNIVNTFNGGVGVDTTGKAGGHNFHRDGLTGIPSGWDGGSTTTSPYFTLEATKSYTFEAVVQFASTDAATAGRDGLMGQVFGNEAWIRADNGFLQYAFVSGGTNANLFSNTIDISSAYNGDFNAIAVVLDRDTDEIRSYLNGVLIHTNTNPNIANLGAMLDGTQDYRTGAYNTAGADAFTGIQDHYRISEGALTPGQFLAVPEPSAFAALAGLFGLGCALIRRRR